MSLYVGTGRLLVAYARHSVCHIPFHPQTPVPL
jgi:hypothetical protein